jgi:endonuclease/exonuclease/phosphatase family metal-dependent hydrolase
MALKIASWNVEGRLSALSSSARGNPEHILRSIKTLDADVVVLLEAHSESSLEELQSHSKLLEMGYHVHTVPYDDDMATRFDSIAARSSLLLLSKIAIRDFNIIRLGDLRNALEATLEYEPNRLLRVIGVHLDDRSEVMRLKQSADLADVINQSSIPSIVMGDFNAMHGHDLWPARVLRSRLAKVMARLIMPDISQRAIDMADGRTLRSLESSTGLVDADSHHRPTATPKMFGREWLPSVRLLQIDHIFHSKDMTVTDFSIAKDGGADHRAISGIISASDS